MRINKDQIVLSKWRDIKFSYKRSQGHCLAYLLNRFRWHCYPRLRYVSRFPGHLDIEISSLCNMQCPMCFTVTDYFKTKIEKGLMDFELFKKIIDEAVKYNLYSIRISHRGEAFMHPEVIDFIRYAKNSGIKEVASLSNILALTPALFEQAMQAGLDWLTISFDGLGNTYESIRKPATFQESLAKIKEYKKIKDKFKTYKPVIKIQSIWPAIKDCAIEFVRLFEPYVDSIASNPLIDYLHKDDPAGIEYWKNFDCPVSYQRLTVLFDGLVPYCHNDEFCTYIVGDVNKDTIHNIWHGQDMTQVRATHQRHSGVYELSSCKYCFLPRKSEPVIEQFGDRKIVVEKYTKRTEEIGA
jgi:hypothetical protein